MSKNEKDIALFVAFCIEEYGAANGMASDKVLELFLRYGVIDYLSEFFDTLHTQGRQWLIEEITEFIDIRRKKHEDIPRKSGSGGAPQDTPIQ